ncbi:9685_t:CDS:2 [Funneliformis geosporum]|uniref:19571_t:CDS:1 n=1 Tax=Funneliformis geosporum TaxID=1117311 RepID=A0A9W4SKU5_9GLOM|nr:9685_t:CDS:2 [Funneliformis geosporum]CAI2173135.1 19571_t:CDS:2 [Funneliformis geosporum]
MFVKTLRNDFQTLQNENKELKQKLNEIDDTTRQHEEKVKKISMKYKKIEEDLVKLRFESTTFNSEFQDTYLKQYHKYTEYDKEIFEKYYPKFQDNYLKLHDEYTELMKNYRDLSEKYSSLFWAMILVIIIDLASETRFIRNDSEYIHV